MTGDAGTCHHITLENLKMIWKTKSENMSIILEVWGFIAKVVECGFRTDIRMIWILKTKLTPIKYVVRSMSLVQWRYWTWKIE